MSTPDILKDDKNDTRLSSRWRASGNSLVLVIRNGRNAWEALGNGTYGSLVETISELALPLDKMLRLCTYFRWRVDQPCPM